MTPLIFSKLNVNRIERQSECNTVFNVYLLVFVDPSTKGRQVVFKSNDRYRVWGLSSSFIYNDYNNRSLFSLSAIHTSQYPL